MKAPLPLWRMTRRRYEKLVECGIFGPGDRVELLDGVLVAREPQGSLHATAVGLARTALERAFGSRYHVREDKPVALDETSEPEPDVVVVRGRLRDYRETHPARPSSSWRSPTRRSRWTASAGAACMPPPDCRSTGS